MCFLSLDYNCILSVTVSIYHDTRFVSLSLLLSNLCKVGGIILFCYIINPFATEFFDLVVCNYFWCQF